MTQHDRSSADDFTPHSLDDMADGEGRSTSLFRREPTVQGLWRRYMRLPTGVVMQGDMALARVLRQG
ncbi:hypothetical protein KHP62_09315 [Rhodobacteraceae bacterium NNCM2]|nr:hypothetical protein [Coraliihabitans acroporae]